jgi:hypothetical protein
MNLSIEYHYWDDARWRQRKQQLADGWKAMPEYGKRELISDLIIHAYDVVPPEKTCRVEYQKIY